MMYGKCLLVCSDMYLAVGDQEKALEIMAENGWIDRSVHCGHMCCNAPLCLWLKEVAFCA